MKYTVESEQEEDGRWLAEVLELPGVMIYAPNSLVKPLVAQASPPADR